MATPNIPMEATNLHYRVEAADLHAHLYGVTLTVAQPAAQQRVSLPVWIAGSYMVREFSKQIVGITARQGSRAVTVKQLDKCTWVLDCQADAPVTLHYQVHAHDDSVRTAWLDAQRGFFNGTSLCLQVAGQTEQPHQLELIAPQARWQVATGLTPLKIDRQGFGTYIAADYDELVDCPVEMGTFWSGTFKAAGIEHRFVVAGATPSFDGERLLRDTQRICEQAIAFWHGKKRGQTPHKNYVFMLNAVADGYGGLEHRNSTALICQRADLPRLDSAPTVQAAATKPPSQGSPPASTALSDGYTTLLGLISHEYFHTWNVKRLRPFEFARYDYTRENTTELLWFFEGFTSYYDDLLLRRAGLIDDAAYLRLLNKTVNQVLQTPGRKVHTVAQSSFEAWTKYYRADANTPNLTVSYYTKGALVALCLDLTLRQHGVKNHSVTLDDVMRALWQRCCTGKRSGSMQEADVLAVLHDLTGRSWAPEFKAWVHGTRELPLEKLLTAHGVTIQHDPAPLAQRLGLRVGEDHSVQIKQVLADSAAQRAGFAPGDEWLGLEVGSPTKLATHSAWRIKKLDDVLLYAGRATQLTALVSRDRQLLRLPLSLPKAKDQATWRLAIQDSHKVAAWLVS
ncbi:M61 family metallopeptidase [Limnohabitans sp. B9-3]|uniref:M61 family metallopeptidase n=1 Tax=Limnohabitans sp. B9-3 TaxID=1100707 RepID=UPI000C1E84CE|nr:M61 family metallopeptidase [Limnohabitans sp. B9-3]PIT76174.1 peptidase M61 [Limnohabitans sp. B9-3]